MIKKNLYTEALSFGQIKKKKVHVYFIYNLGQLRVVIQNFER